ncbi:UNVERIFIED_CONTAM: hypothetical protein O8I53_05605 [Campylobacter lari]
MPNLYLHDPNNLVNHEYLPEIKALYKPKKVNLNKVGNHERK